MAISRKRLPSFKLSEECCCTSSMQSHSAPSSRSSSQILPPTETIGLETQQRTYKFFPKNYTVFRKDRNVNGGGVFVAASDSRVSYEIPDLDTGCEIIWAGLNFSGSNPLYIASFYKPPNTTSLPLEALASSYNKLITLLRRSSRNIAIGGDINLLGIDWKACQTGCTNKSQH